MTGITRCLISDLQTEVSIFQEVLVPEGRTAMALILQLLQTAKHKVISADVIACGSQSGRAWEITHLYTCSPGCVFPPWVRYACQGPGSHIFCLSFIS